MKKGMATLLAMIFCLGLVTIAKAEVNKNTAASAGSVVTSTSTKVAMVRVKNTKKRMSHKKGPKGPKAPKTSGSTGK